MMNTQEKKTFLSISVMLIIILMLPHFMKSGMLVGLPFTLEQVEGFSKLMIIMVLLVPGMKDLAEIYPDMMAGKK